MRAPNFWKSGKSRTPYKKRLFSVGKRKKMLPKFFWRLRDTYKKYILQKNWVKTAIPALSSGQSNLQTPIWGCHRQLDDQHRNPNMNNKDHIVGQLTTPRVPRCHRVLEKNCKKTQKLYKGRHKKLFFLLSSEIESLII